MEKRFKANYAQLNEAQKRAVDTIYGPVLVIAGPGTGKTQLLTMRVANILKSSDALPENIICLTFTDSGVRAMRQRLETMIGKAAYDVTISTYHAFGSDLLRRFSDYFSEYGSSEPADELGQFEIMQNIIGSLPYGNPFKFIDDRQESVRSVISCISDCKRSLILPGELKQIASSNITFIEETASDVKTIFDGYVARSKQSYQKFEEVLDYITKHSHQDQQSITLATLLTHSLEEALSDFHSTNSTKPLTAWKNKWLEKDDNDKFVIAGKQASRKTLAFADIYSAYNAQLKSKGLFDYDDMIMRAIKGLQQHDELRFNLQERYQFVLLDEFQDTNASQLELVQLLTNNPSHEGKPNVLAVGDDDQAIYAFQGADYSNMLQFMHNYQDVEVIALTDNYRSHSDILSIAHAVADQITERLHHNLDSITKELVARSSVMPEQACLEQHNFKSDVAEYAWVAQKIDSLIKEGANPSEIAVLAPKHYYLEQLLPHLQRYQIPVTYEKREDVLSAPHIEQILELSALIVALSSGSGSTDELWLNVLRMPLWGIPTRDLWQLHWKLYDSRQSYTDYFVNTDIETMAPAFALPLHFCAALALKAQHESLETMLDYIIGQKPVEVDARELRSPYFEYYFSNSKQTHNFGDYYSALSDLSVLRAHIRSYKRDSENALKLADMLAFADVHKSSGIKVLNTSPHKMAPNSVQLMTAYKSKGLEFEHVFLLACVDEVWGSKARSNSSVMVWPANLRHIAYAGATDNERLRLFFVALTRAKHTLFISSHDASFDGKQTTKLRYFADDTMSLAELTIHEDELDTETLEATWTLHGPITGDSDMKSLLENRLANYQLSATHLNTFTDMFYGGPNEFFVRYILRFPSAPSLSGEYGNAIHETMQWLQQQALSGNDIDINSACNYFAAKLRQKRLTPVALEQLLARGNAALTNYIPAKTTGFSLNSKQEFDFKHENVFVGEAHLSGKIDRLVIDEKNKLIDIVDFKTGQPYKSWTPLDHKLHKYRQQLLFYKLLVENSRSFKGYKLRSGCLEFIEPDQDGQLHSLSLDYESTEKEYRELQKLIEAVWQRIKSLDFDLPNSYSKSLKGTLNFERDLIADKQTDLQEL